MTELDMEVPVVPKAWQQLGVLVLDASPSMTLPANDGSTLTKAQAVNLAVRELLSRFKASRKRQNFSFSVVTFHDHVSNDPGIVPAGDVDDNADYDPTANGMGSGTYLGAGLIKAAEICQDYFA